MFNLKSIENLILTPDSNSHGYKTDHKKIRQKLISIYFLTLKQGPLQRVFKGRKKVPR